MGFLRPDHTFLSRALRHPTSTFLLFNKLDPLVSSPTSIATVTFADVKPIIGEDPFSKTEEETIKEYNSSIYVPQIIFLGLDERKEGLVYKDHYKGQPWFAVDVTPKESVKEAAEKLIEGLKEKKLEFINARMHMTFPAQEGKPEILTRRRDARN